MVTQKGLPEEVADKIWTFAQRKGTRAYWRVRACTWVRVWDLTSCARVQAPRW